MPTKKWLKQHRNIYVNKETHKRLWDRAVHGESFDEVIVKLLDNAEARENVAAAKPAKPAKPVKVNVKAVKTVKTVKTAPKTKPKTTQPKTTKRVKKRVTFKL